MADNLQINRWFELTIGDGITAEAVTITPPMSCTFDITKSSTSLRKSNSGEIRVYNIPDDKLALLKGDYPVVVFKVGYVGTGVVTLIKGEVISVSTVKDGGDKLTTLQVGSGYVASNHKTVQKVVPEGQTVKQIIEALIDDVPEITKGVLSGNNINKVALYGYSMSGTVRGTLENLARTYYLDYNIDNDILYVHDADGTISDDFITVPLISELSGLIDLPYDNKIAVGKAKKSVANKGGVHFKTLLNPTLVAGSIIKLESPTISGVFKLSEVTHSGGNRINDWYSSCKCEDRSTAVSDEELKQDIFPVEETL